MPEISIKRNGTRISIEEVDIPEFDKVIEITEMLLDKYKNQHSMDIEVNFVEFRKLGKELRYDHRINQEYVEINQKRLKRTLGRILTSDLLIEGYKHKKIVYVCYIPKGLPFLVIYTLIHELYHFLDEFQETKDHRTPLPEGGQYIDTQQFIKNQVCIMLNEYIAEYKTSKYLLEIIPSIDFIIRKSKFNIDSQDDNLITYFRSLNGKDINDFEVQLEIFSFLFNDFFKLLMYFLGAWRSCSEKNYNTTQFEESWENLLQKITQRITKDFSEFFENLNIIQVFRIINHLFEDSPESFEESERLIKDKLEVVYMDFLTKLKRELLVPMNYSNKITLRFYQFLFLNFLSNKPFFSILHLARLGLYS